MVSLIQDLRYAARTLLKSPGFTIVAVLTLALGIGANVAIFSVVYGVLLRPLPFTHPEQLVRIFDDLAGPNTPDVGMSAPELWDLEERSGVFQEVSAVAPGNSAVGGGERTVRVEALITSPDYFELLGAKPELGRVYTRQDSVPGFLEPVVISDGFWQRNYGSDPKIIGRKMSLDRDLYTIVGVMPSGFRHPGRTLDTDVEVWLGTGFNGAPFPVPADRTLRFIPAAIGRLKPGISVAQAQSQLNAYVAQLTREYPAAYPAASKWRVRLVSVQEDLVGPQRTELFILFGAVGFSAADRLREYCEFAAGARFRAAARNCDSVGDGGEPRAAGAAAFDGEHAAGGDFRLRCAGYGAVLEECDREHGTGRYSAVE